MDNSSPNGIISDLGRLIGIPCLALSSDGSCRLLFDGEHLVSLIFIPALGTLTIACKCSGEPNTNAEIAKLALRENFMRAGMSSSTFSLSSDGKLYLHTEVCFQRMTTQAILDTIEQLLHKADVWRNKIAQTSSQSVLETGPAELLQR